ncbi:phosphatase 2C-like domain-containing protein [Pseudomassariella vexata]|uniref:Phosphatase 2C-like domain-containing protein n=1 Tax=Pseudomassariella vexata TaxID=1141098 RepID=A0A1Y2DI44_9PEZI|nr:phosphatase 2C-like domain-containing protein [Pseudomassariella vexata]ORY58909.1 phosphatase 2C-like domain-containing protein [Pseudomassariella vexata]
MFTCTTLPRLRSCASIRVTCRPGPDEAEVSRILNQDKGAYTRRGANGSGFEQYDGVRIASNGPTEDFFVHGMFPSPLAGGGGGNWMAWGVFDGHAGSQTAEHLTKQLLPFVRHSLQDVTRSISPRVQESENAPVEAVQSAIKNAFVALDDAIINGAIEAVRNDESYQDKVMKLAIGYAGSCALLSLFDPDTKTLHVACAGDSRAVLGRKGADGTWETVPLSVDQTGANEAEIARINAEHPGEEGICKNGRMLGLMVTRALGDGRWKWTNEFQKEVTSAYNAPALNAKYPIKTPPYLIAEPVVTSTKINTEQPTFLIMASDGLWDRLSSEQAVGLIIQWLDWRAKGKPLSQGPEKQYAPFDLQRYSWETENPIKFREERTTIQDDNAAVHLVRNALGGNNHEMVAGTLVFGPPFSRYVRDDITVQVVIFKSQ